MVCRSGHLLAAACRSSCFRPPITIAEYFGSRLQSDHPPENIVSMVLSTTEIIFATGAAKPPGSKPFNHDDSRFF
jgi:ABC-type Fe3+-hydroxamate transport system substrate-binding protein